MNYYQFHIGDYRSATAHLTNEEDLVYRRLLDMYYDSEKPIPKETQWVSRRLRVGSEVVTRVLQDFFKEGENGWVHRRCETEIAGYRDIVARNRNNGKLGGRPRKTQSVSSGNPVVTLTSNQEPKTKNQKPEEKKKETSRISDENADEVFLISKKKKKLSGKRLETFMLFWEAFNFKKGRADAVDAWLEIPALTDRLVLEIVAAAKKEASERAGIVSAGKTPKWAQGWITGRRWEDEIGKEEDNAERWKRIEAKCNHG